MNEKLEYLKLTLNVWARKRERERERDVVECSRQTYHYIKDISIGSLHVGALSQFVSPAILSLLKKLMVPLPEL